MTLVFLPEASAELYEAAEYYESKQEGTAPRIGEPKGGPATPSGNSSVTQGPSSLS
jgi:hypothetical protein